MGFEDQLKPITDISGQFSEEKQCKQLDRENAGIGIYLWLKIELKRMIKEERGNDLDVLDMTAHTPLHYQCCHYSVSKSQSRSYRVMTSTLPDCRLSPTILYNPCPHSALIPVTIPQVQAS